MTPSTSTTIVDPGVAKPLKLGLAILVMLSPTTPLSLLAGSKSVSKEDAGTVFPHATHHARLRRSDVRTQSGQAHRRRTAVLVAGGIGMLGVLPLAIGRHRGFPFGYRDCCLQLTTAS